MLSIHLSSMMELKNYATTNHVQFWGPLSTYMGLVKDKQTSSRKEDQSNPNVLLTSSLESWGSEDSTCICLFCLLLSYVINKTMVNKLRAFWCPPDTTLCPQDSRGIVLHRASQIELSLNTGQLIGNWFPNWRSSNWSRLKGSIVWKHANERAPYQTMLTDFLWVCPSMLH